MFLGVSIHPKYKLHLINHTCYFYTLVMIPKIFKLISIVKKSLVNIPIILNIITFFLNYIVSVIITNLLSNSHLGIELCFVHMHKSLLNLLVYQLSIRLVHTNIV